MLFCPPATAADQQRSRYPPKAPDGAAAAAAGRSRGTASQAAAAESQSAQQLRGSTLAARAAGQTE